MSNKYVSLANLVRYSGKVKEKLATKANPDGFYEGLTAGEAISARQIDPLSSESGTTQSAPFISQGTGTNNNTDSVDTPAFAKMLEKQGNTIPVIQPLSLSQFNRSYYSTDAADSLTFTNNVARITSGGIDVGVQGNALIGNGLSTVFTVGHKYIVIFEARASVSAIISASLDYSSVNTNSAAGINAITLSTSWKRCYGLANITSNSHMGVRISTSKVNRLAENEYFEVQNLVTFDVTSWNSSILTDLESNPSHFSWYYNGPLTYNAGSLQNANGRYLGCTDRNIYSSIDDYTVVIPNRAFNYKGSSTTTITYYDNNKTVIGTESVASDSQFTTPANCFYITSSVTSGVTISLYYSPEQGGEGYNQHYDYVAPKTYDTGTEELLAFDNKLPSGVIGRNTGEHKFTNNDNWGIGGQTIGGMYRYYHELSDMMVGTALKGRCSKFDVIPYGTNIATYSGANAVAFGYSNRYIQFLSATEFTTDQLKALFLDVEVQYPLATPTTEQGTPYPENIEINDYGMMYWLDTDGNLVSIPQGCKIQYPPAYVEFTDTLSSRAEGDAGNIALNGELGPDDANTLKGVNDRIGSVSSECRSIEGGILRQMLATAKSIDFNNTKAIMLDSLTFSYNEGWHGFIADIADYTNEYSAGDTKPNLMCSNYKCGNYQETSPCIRAWSGLGTNKILLLDLSLGTDVTSDAFKNAIKGMILAYKKAST